MSEVFGTGWKHASAHLRWQVTALRLPEVLLQGGQGLRRPLLQLRIVAGLRVGAEQLHRDLVRIGEMQAGRVQRFLTGLDQVGLGIAEIGRGDPAVQFANHR